MRNEVRILEKADFPPLLHEIPDCPKSLYIRGSIPSIESRFLVVVGSRSFSQYGKDVTEKLIKGLSGHNITIVSGLALGIDGIAHKAALEAGLKTVAVLGSGLDDSVLHPRVHRPLAMEIIENGGALLSEEEPMKKAAPYMFPKRNRIVAGMSDATLIIEATEKSGTLITARLAMDYNREVLTVPGSIYSANSAGPLHLIKNGAAPVSNASEVLAALGLDVSQESFNFNLQGKEKLVYERTKVPIERIDLEQDTGLETSELNTILSALEIRGILRQRLGKIEHV